MRDAEQRETARQFINKWKNGFSRKSRGRRTLNSENFLLENKKFRKNYDDID